MIIQKEVQKIINEVAKLNNITYSEACEIVFSQFEYVRNTIREGTKNDFDSFPAVRLRYFGTFTPSVGKVMHMSKHAKRKEGLEDEKHS